LRFFGDVRANSIAVLRPIPDDAPVTMIVLPSRRLPIAVAMVRVGSRWVQTSCPIERLGVVGLRYRRLKTLLVLNVQQKVLLGSIRGIGCGDVVLEAFEKECTVTAPPHSQGSN